MSTRVEVPSLGESITEAVLVKWLKSDGAQVAADEPLCELESDKATVDLPAPAAGVLRQAMPAGQTVRVGDVIAQIEPVASPTAATKPGPAASQRREAPPPPAPPSFAGAKPGPVMASRRAAEAAEIAVHQPPTEPAPAHEGKIAAPAAEHKTAERETPAEPSRPLGFREDGVRRVPMSKIRRRIAERLVRAQQTAAMLTTFNEVDMTAVQELRKRHGERFKEMHGVSLGLMSFFARACVLALKQFPALNAQIDGDDILYHDHVHLGIAVSTERGLVVPVLRNAEQMSFARIEGEIKRAAAAARDGKLTLQELTGGTFTITNGGIFGSLLSTPILNPPQTGILGMHAIQERPVAINRQIEIRPMMYLALTYDHRLVDGRESVSFLVRVKQLLEEPMQMILEI